LSSKWFLPSCFLTKILYVFSPLPCMPNAMLTTSSLI
jgi:hypothetical protein